MTLRGLFQIAYVTRNLDRAIEHCRSMAGDAVAMDIELPLRTPAGDRTMALRVGTAWVGGTQIELIQPVSGHIDAYVTGLPSDPEDFVPRFHHVAVRREDPEALADEVAALGLPVVFETGGNGISSVFVDARERIGHPIEFVCASAAGWGLLGWPG